MPRGSTPSDGLVRAAELFRQRGEPDAARSLLNAGVELVQSVDDTATAIRFFVASAPVLARIDEQSSAVECLAALDSLIDQKINATDVPQT